MSVDRLDVVLGLMTVSPASMPLDSVLLHMFDTCLNLSVAAGGILFLEHKKTAPKIRAAFISYE